MATITIDSTQPGATTGWPSANVVTLVNAVKNLLEADRKGLGYQLAPDEYQCLWALVNGNADGKTATATTVSGIVTTYT